MQIDGTSSPLLPAPTSSSGNYRNYLPTSSTANLPGASLFRGIREIPELTARKPVQQQQVQQPEMNSNYPTTFSSNTLFSSDDNASCQISNQLQQQQQNYHRYQQQQQQMQQLQFTTTHDHDHNQTSYANSIFTSTPSSSVTNSQAMYFNHPACSTSQQAPMMMHMHPQQQPASSSDMFQSDLFSTINFNPTYSQSSQMNMPWDSLK
jgi:hypothetical protein